MFDHLVRQAPEIVPVPAFNTAFLPAQDAAPEEVFSAQVKTSAWLAELGAPDDEEITAQQQAMAAREAFSLLVTPSSPATQRESLLRLKSPNAVDRLNLLLTTYEWEFIDRAKELRAYAVGKILEETNHVDARIRLRALELLGKVTEVSLFTDRVHIQHTNTGDENLEQRVREKLQKFLISSGQLEDAVVVEKPQEPQEPHEIADDE